ncbi:MAG: hypothetical protein ACPGYP_08235 [Solirubrobacterales bacterium]
MSVAPSQNVLTAQSWLVDSIKSYAYAVYALAGATSFVLLAAAYDAADPRLPATAIITVGAVFVAASLARAEAAPAALVVAGVGVAVAMVKSKHPAHLEATSAYALIGFSLLASSIAAHWIFGSSFAEPRPQNRVEAVYAVGAFCIACTGAFLVTLLMQIHDDSTAVARIVTSSQDVPPSAYFSVDQLVALAVPCLLVGSLFAMRLVPRIWSLAALQIPDAACRVTELSALCALLGGGSYLFATSLVADGAALPTASIAAVALMVGFLIWVATTALEPESLEARRKMRGRMLWIVLLVAIVSMFLYLLVTGNNVLGKTTALVIWIGAVIGFRPFT